MLLQQIDKFFSSFRKYFFYYKDGFFQLPFLSNSPEAVVRSLTKMPFVKHFEKEHKFSSNTPFLRADVYYQEIEEGLWTMYAEAEYKANVNYRRIEDKNLPSDYYLLTLEISQSEFKEKPALVNGFSYSDCSWLLLKPKASGSLCYFKGSKATSLPVYFNQKWLKTFLYKEERFLTSKLNHFFESDDQQILWPEKTEIAESLRRRFTDIFHNKGEKTAEDARKLKDLIHEFIFYFIDKYNADDIGKNYIDISDNDRKRILKAEHLLIKNIHAPFAGIENLSSKAGISPTKLKNDFKLVFGETIFQYFRKKQMEYAKHLVMNSGKPIKEIAREMGYENAAKFSAAFREHIGVLPSEV